MSYALASILGSAVLNTSVGSDIPRVWPWRGAWPTGSLVLQPTVEGSYAGQFGTMSGVLEPVVSRETVTLAVTAGCTLSEHLRGVPEASEPARLSRELDLLVACPA
jgi:hypothetical protein